MAGEVVFSNLGGHAWQSRPAMPGGPVLADVMTPSSVPIMLVRPGYRPELNIDATLRGYLDTVRQEIARRPRPVLQAPAPAPARRAAVATGGTRKPSGATKPGGATTPPPVTPKPEGLDVEGKDTALAAPVTDQQNFYTVDDQGWVPPKTIPNIRAFGAGEYTPGKYAGEVLAGGLLAGMGAATGSALYKLYDMYRRTSVIPKPALGSGRLLSAPKPTPTTTPTLGAPSGSLPPGSGAIYQPYTPGGSSMPIRMPPASGQPLSVMQSGPTIQLPRLAQSAIAPDATSPSYKSFMDIMNSMPRWWVSKYLVR